jgi:aspartate/glutamate racemase
LDVLDEKNGLIGGSGPELPLILTRDELGIPFLNAAAIHVEAMVLTSLGFQAGFSR